MTNCVNGLALSGALAGDKMKATEINGYRLGAPLNGRIVPLDQLPDPMFALGMMGAGVAIEPMSGEVRAPCAGEVFYVHKRGHAIKLRTREGAEILIHIGLESVAMHGEGFRVKVAEGQRINEGDLLLQFDHEQLASQCGPITTPVLVVNDTAFSVVSSVSSGVVEIGGDLMFIGPVSIVEEAEERRAERSVVIEMLQGLHARPAALLAAKAKEFSSTIEIVLGERRANAKSPVALLTLGSRHGSRLLVSADGADAEAAVDAVATAIASGLGDPLSPIERAACPEAANADEKCIVDVELPPFGPRDTADLKGVSAAPGLAIGNAVRLATRRQSPQENGQGVTFETEALSKAIDVVHRHLNGQAKSGRTEQQREIMQAHAELVNDLELHAAALQRVSEGKSAGFAWSAAIEAQIESLRKLDNPRLRERADDLIDLKQQVLTVLAGDSIESTMLPKDAIVIADDLLPSQFMAFGEHLPAGIVVARGGRTSHVAILAASSGVPMLAAVGQDTMRILEGLPLILDTEQGLVRVNPSCEVIEATRQAVITQEARRAANLASANVDCVMADGTRLPIYANIGSVADAARGVAFGAEGSGLLRTEFLFLDRYSAPTEVEQLAEYQAIACELRGLPLTIRTLDAGGDKPIPYVSQAREENPIVGVRGIRVAKRHPDLLRQQFRSILGVKPASQCRIMLPMITDVSEVRWARNIFEEEKAKLGIKEEVPLGIMIEVPAAVALADQLAAEADFFSIGTNDLTQYVLAMDRGNTELAAEIDAFHPAVLRMIAQTVKGASVHDRPVGVCGSMASDILAAPVLIGLGITSLSATRSSIPDLKAFIRTLDKEACYDIAQQALELDTAEAVRGMIGERYPGIL